MIKGVEIAGRGEGEFWWQCLDPPSFRELVILQAMPVKELKDVQWKAIIYRTVNCNFISLHLSIQYI